MKTRRTIEIILMLVVVTVAIAVFGVKTDTAREVAEIQRLNGKIASERQRISELTAEWSALDHPARIQGLLERHNEVLGLGPIAAEQINAVELMPPSLPLERTAASVPSRPQPPEAR